MIKITTYYNRNQRIEEREELKIDVDNGIENSVINVYPEVTYQTLYGFGGAVTEAAAYVYSKMTEGNKKEFIEAYYGENGLGYTFGRCSVDSCDFGLGNYCSRENVNAPLDLSRDEQYVIPLLSDIYKKKEISLFMSPWSPPAFMKTTGERNRGGSLKVEYYADYAKHIREYLQTYQAKGFDIFAINTQNEPKAVQAWDSCVYTIEEERKFMEEYLYPELVQNGMGEIKRLVWDHNRERVYERYRDIYEGLTDKAAVDGVAYHWYSGDHFELLRLISEKYPDALSVFTEGCIEYSHIDKTDIFGHAARYAHEIIGCFNNGCNVFIDWNILLDKEGGPNHVRNFCAAPIMADDENNPIRQPSYYIIGHFSKYLQKGAKRVALSCFSKDVEATAWINPDNSLIIVVFNGTGTDRGIYLRINGKMIKFDCKKNSISTFQTAIDEL